MDTIIHPLLGLFRIIKKIGNGSFATVYLGKHAQLQYPVAFKIYHSNNDEIIQKSFDITKSITHPFICKDFDLIKTQKGENCVLMEYVEGKTLLEYANINAPLQKHDIQEIFGEIIVAVDFLHRHHIIHRDLKCENILIDENKNIRLIDLNFSCPNGILHSTICGSPGYVAPEIIQNKLYNDSVDIWSLGIILYAITFGKLPFENNNVYMLFKKVVSEEPSYSSNRAVNEDLIDLIKKMLIKNPKNRITIEEIKNHPFFTAGTTEKTYIFSQQRLNYYINDQIYKTDIQMHILQQMQLTLSESLKTINDIKSCNLTYNTMTYNILNKIYISNVQIKNYSKNINYQTNPLNSDRNLPTLDNNNEKVKYLSHSVSYDGFSEKETQKVINQFDLQTLLNSNVNFRKFSSLAKPISGIRRRIVSGMRSVPQLKSPLILNELNLEGETAVSKDTLPQLNIYEQ